MIRLLPGLQSDLNDLMVRHRREPCQDIFDVGVGVDATTAATREDRVDHRSLSRQWLPRSDEHKVFPAWACCNRRQIHARMTLTEEVSDPYKNPASIGG